MKISIIIPAYNEESRIEKTIRTYYDFFSKKQHAHTLFFELIVVLNGCKDNTVGVVERTRTHLKSDNIIIIDMPEAGKGLAVKAGFADALTRNNNLIGFVDADLATMPDAFYDLITNIHDYDGIIASRYMPQSQICPTRPFYKRYGSRFIYEPFVWLLFRLSYYDLQCGAKLFKYETLANVNPKLTVAQWGFDAELLYLCKKNGYAVKEIPTVWCDQAGSSLTLWGGLQMFSALFKVWRYHIFTSKK